jgi:Raf kinase inhibitor-like YbhB/YbcL family protein
MKITSSAFEDEGQIPVAHSADGDGSLPPLEIAHVPGGTVSLAITCIDPDVPRDRRADGNFDHWVVWNLPPDNTNITDEIDHGGIVGLNTFGHTDWVPCSPPTGDGAHRYFFTAYALGTELDLPAESTRAELEAAIEGHVIEDAQLMGTFER